jgi:hypothetical protein
VTRRPPPGASTSRIIGPMPHLIIFVGFIIVGLVVSCTLGVL